jgi:hypothetical protein
MVHMESRSAEGYRSCHSVVAKNLSILVMVGFACSFDQVNALSVRSSSKRCKSSIVLLNCLITLLLIDLFIFIVPKFCFDKKKQMLYFGIWNRSSVAQEMHPCWSATKQTSCSREPGSQLFDMTEICTHHTSCMVKHQLATAGIYMLNAPLLRDKTNNMHA